MVSIINNQELIAKSACTIPQPQIKCVDACDYVQTKKNIYDEFVLSSSAKGEKIKPKEAIKLMVNGAVSQVKGLVKQAIKNPLKVIIPAALSTIAIMALPLIGVPSAVGAGAVAIATAGISAVRLGSNIFKACKNSKQGEYNKARENYKNIGNSTFDLALSLPFLPKAIKSVGEFAKYGKIQLNVAAIKSIKKPADILPTLKNANQEIYRSYDYIKTVDSKLSSFSMSKGERAKIRKELLEFNVPEDEIANIVAKKLAESKGYSLYPKPEYKPMCGNIQGSYNQSTGKLTLADSSKPPLPSQERGEHLNLNRIIENDNATYRCEMVNSVTGEISYELVPKQLMDDFRKLDRHFKQLSLKGKKVLTVVHEFEHFDQHSKIARLNGVNPKYGDAAQKLYRQAIKEQGVIAPNTPLAQETQRYASVNIADNKNFVKYLQNAREVGARAAESRALNSAEFQRLESVFNALPELRNVKCAEGVLPSVIQTTAAKS